MLHCELKRSPEMGFCTGVAKKLDEAAHQSFHQCARHQKQLNIQFKATFSFFMARAFTVFDAGLALKTQGSLVKGLMPFLAGEAGFFFNFKFKKPANLKFPFFLISAQATAKRASMTPFTCLFFNSFVSATEAITWVWVSTPEVDFAFMAAFMAFIALAGAMMERQQKQKLLETEM